MKISILLISFFLLVFSSKMNAQNGIYTSFDIGMVITNKLPSAAEVGANQEKKPIFPSIYHFEIGYNHDLSPHLGTGLELGFSRTSKTNYLFSNRNVGVYEHYLSFLAVVAWQIQQWRLAVKAGAARGRVVINDGALNHHNDGSIICPELGLGLEYYFHPHMAVTANFDYIVGKNTHHFNELRHQAPTIQALLMGIKFIF